MVVFYPGFMSKPVAREAAAFAESAFPTEAESGEEPDRLALGFQNIDDPEPGAGHGSPFVNK